jgi:sec-independent protein translocase protein TatB
MFDIGFSELLVIGIVALVVIGPEKLPRLARTLGHLAGKLQRYVSDVKADINREIELEDLKKMRDSMQQAASDFKGNFEGEINKTEAELQKAADEINKTTADINKSLNSAPSSETPAPPAQTAFETPSQEAFETASAQQPKPETPASAKT